MPEQRDPSVELAWIEAGPEQARLAHQIAECPARAEQR